MMLKDGSKFVTDNSDCSCWVLIYIHRNRRLIRDGNPGRPPQLSHSSWTLNATDDDDDDDDAELHVLGCWLTSLLGTNRDQACLGKHGSMLLYVRRNRTAH